jgi:hypothetical protein
MSIVWRQKDYCALFQLASRRTWFDWLLYWVFSIALFYESLHCWSFIFIENYAVPAIWLVDQFEICSLHSTGKSWVQGPFVTHVPVAFWYRQVGYVGFVRTDWVTN